MFELFTRFAAAATTANANPCPGGDFLFFPTWYKYLPGKPDPTSGLCTPQMTSLNDVWLVLAAAIEILLRVAALAAVGFIIYGGYIYLTSQGEPDKTTQARKTILNAAIGLGIAVLATAVVAFMAGSVSG